MAVFNKDYTLFFDFQKQERNNEEAIAHRFDGRFTAF